MKFITSIFVFISASCVGADWYLSSAATGVANGTSWTDAWTDTLGVGWSSINPGDTLWVQGGNYSNWSVSGEKGITIRIATNATTEAVFVGTSNSSFSDIDNSTVDGLLSGQHMFKFPGTVAQYTALSSIIRLINTTNATLRGIEVDRSARTSGDTAPVNGLILQNSSGANDLITVEDCWLHHLSGDGININNPGPNVGYDRYTIRRCTISHTQDDAVQMSGNGTVEDCFFDRGGVLPSFGGHQDGVQSAIRAQYIQLRNNEVRDYTQGFYVEQSDGNVVVYNNIMIGGGYTNGSYRGIATGVDNVTNVLGEFYVFNNTMFNYLTYYGSQFGTLYSAVTNGFTNCYVGNNLYLNCKRIATGGGILTTNNIYWDLPGVQYYSTSGNPESPSDKQAGSSVNADPLFVDVGTLDFHLMSNSPAIGNARAMTNFTTTDKSGRARGSVWDIGAYEYQSGDEGSGGGSGSTNLISVRANLMRIGRIIRP